MRRIFNLFRNLPLLKPVVIRVERLIQQRNSALSLHKEAVEQLFLERLPVGGKLQDLSDHPEWLKKYNRMVQRQSLVLHWNGVTRSHLAKEVIRGEGIEIGGLHCPVLLPENCQVTYVDRYPHTLKRETYRELNDYLLIIPTILASSETLGPIKQASLDFIIANHMLEHSENPIQVLLNMSSKLKSDGLVYLAIPDKRASFDKKRSITPPNHILSDFVDGPHASRESHMREYGKKVMNLREKKLEEYIAKFDHNSDDIHFHVWTPNSFRELLQLCETKLEWPYKSYQIFSFTEEFIAILRK